MSDFSSSSSGDQRHSPVHFLRAVRQHLLLVIGFVVVALLAAAFFVHEAQKQYVATADIAINPLSAGDETFAGFSLFQQALDGSSTVVTAAREFDSPQIRGPAAAAMGRAGRNATITINPLSQSDIVAITATAPHANQAARAATSFAESIVASRTALFKSELARHITVLKDELASIPPSERAGNFQYSTLGTQLGTLKAYNAFGDPTVHLVAKAAPPAAPSWPRPTLTYAVALIVSLILGCGTAILLEILNPKVNREEDLLLDQRLPILARIPRLKPRVVKRYLMRQDPLPTSAWKAYRLLRAVLTTSGHDGKFPRSILVTSASPGDGKTLTAANLAITLAAADLRVVLIDGDFHRPMASVVFGRTPRGGGLGAVLSEEQPLTAVLAGSPYPGLSLLLSHQDTSVQANLTSEHRMRALLLELRAYADVVVIDSPPLPEVAEALEMAAAVDAVLLCVRLGNTRRDKLDQLREMLSRRDISPVGFVVTTRLLPARKSGYDDAYAGRSPKRDPVDTLPGRGVASLPGGRSLGQ